MKSHKSSPKRAAQIQHALFALKEFIYLICVKANMYKIMTTKKSRNEQYTLVTLIRKAYGYNFSFTITK